MWDVNADNIVISKLIETKNNSKYLIGFSHNVIRPLLLILPEMSGYFKTFKEKNNKLMPLRIDDDKHKTIMTKTKDL